jgi:hypothetical protein
MVGQTSISYVSGSFIIESELEPTKWATIFGHITALCQQFEQKHASAISVDCKKKDLLLLGTFKNQGHEWQPKEQETRVNVYDFRSLANGKAIPYGIYDLVHNQGFVNVVEVLRQRAVFAGARIAHHG